MKTVFTKHIKFAKSFHIAMHTQKMHTCGKLKMYIHAAVNI